MFRLVGNSAVRAFNQKLVAMPNQSSVATVLPGLLQQQPRRMYSHEKEETPEEFDQRFIDFFNNPEIDGWFIRKGLAEIQREDVIPDPKIICAALKACRRVNDFALAVRVLEAMRFKCGDKINELYPYLMQECKSTMDELGIPTLDEIGYEKPEFHIPDPSWWPKEYYEIYNIRQRNIIYDPKAHYY